MLKLRAIKEFPGRESRGVSCKVFWQDQYVADYIDYGDGGEAWLTAVDYPGFEALLAAYPNTLPTGDLVLDQLLLATKTRTVRAEIAIEAALQADAVAKKAKAHVKRGSVVFRTAQQKPNEFLGVKTTDKNKTMARLRAEYPGVQFFVAQPDGWAWVA